MKKYFLFFILVNAKECDMKGLLCVEANYENVSKCMVLRAPYVRAYRIITFIHSFYHPDRST